jgi:hypothetical protein
MSIDNFETISKLDSAQVAKEVYELAASDDALAPLVKEALDVIDQTLDKHGCAIHSPRSFIS